MALRLFAGCWATPPSSSRRGYGHRQGGPVAARAAARPPGSIIHFGYRRRGRGGGPPGATLTFVEASDPSGRYLVGGYEGPQGNRRPLLWDNGNLVVLNTPGQDNSSIVVNEQGVVAGTSTTVIEGKLDFYNWTYRNGTVDLITDVRHGPVEYRGVVDINARGDILLDSRTRIS